MELLIIGGVILAVVLWLGYRVLRRRVAAIDGIDSSPLTPEAELALPYRKKDWLFTRGERAFYDALHTAMGETYHLYPKVRLVDLVWLPRGIPKRQQHLNRVMAKHVDFVLCDRQTIAPQLIIELDDALHDREERRVRDAFIDRVLQAAGLPILHIRARASYEPRELEEQIHSLLSSKSTPSASSASVPVAEQPYRHAPTAPIGPQARRA